jgi:hypothetical protein
MLLDRSHIAIGAWRIDGIQLNNQVPDINTIVRIEIVSVHARHTSPCTIQECIAILQEPSIASIERCLQT